MEQTLTIGIAHHTDYHGAYFTIQDIRKELLFNQRYDLLKKIEFLVIENEPDSKHAIELKRLAQSGGQKIRVIDFDATNGTSATRNKIIEEAKSNFVLVMDCHVLLCPVVSTIASLFRFMEYNKNTKDLFTGPLVYDSMGQISTHFNDKWGGQMWGQWGKAWQCICESFNFSVINDNNKCSFVSLADQKKITKCDYCESSFPELEYAGHEQQLNKKGYSPIGGPADSEPFEIFAQGLGLFFTKKNSWLGFNEHARGFGGEECYIHEKYRKAGRKTILLPFLKWLHRFGRPDGVPYELTLENKVRNYILEFTELGLDLTPVRRHFVLENNFSSSKWDELIKEASSIYGSKTAKTEDNTEDLANQIKILQEKLSKAQQGTKCCKGR